MSIVTVDTTSAEPPYEQVRRQIAEGAASGALRAGHKLPTVRQLASDLGLANNTVARAYRELEIDGVIETHGRRGTFIASRRIDDSEGLSIDEAIRLVEKHWH